MDSASQTSADDAKIKSDLFNLIEKLQIDLQKRDQELQKKDEELAKERQEKQKLSARANRADRLETMNAALQRSLWRSFPSQFHYYYIKVKVPSGTDVIQYRYLHADNSGHLRSDFTTRNQFDFRHNSNGSYSIYSVSMGKYLKTQTSSNYSMVIFSATDKDSADEFVLFFHQQSQHSALLVDISSLDGYFLYRDKNNNFVVANSSDPPANKFLIIPVDE